MISTSDFKTGMTIEYDNSIYQIIEFQHVKPGKGQAFVRTKLRNLRTSSLTDVTFGAGEKMEQAMIEKKKMQYLYVSGEFYSFMDMETYEQIEMPAERLQYEKNFMLEGMEVIIVDYKGEILGVQLPEKVALEVVECAPGVRGNTAANATKDAVLETGHRVLVPLFVETGDKIIVSTIDGKYSSRA
ncbi:MAG: elongation factor P [Bacilli bacterium]|jgi:elongation factor P|nr:elongation factor P [Bacilli bacterium]MDY0064219.1 elongation factor P [Bacilli bacterium]